jgi:hypothetical protein
MVEVLAGFMEAGIVLFWKYAARKLAAVQSLFLLLLSSRRRFLLAASSLTNMNSVSSESEIETSGSRGGVTIVLLVQVGIERLNAQQNPTSITG